jgi:hypothetical protein
MLQADWKSDEVVGISVAQKIDKQARKLKYIR